MNESTDEFVQLAVAKNVPITLVNHPEGVHGFDMLNDDERSREIIRMTLEFIKVHLGNQRGSNSNPKAHHIRTAPSGQTVQYEQFFCMKKVKSRSVIHLRVCS